MERPAGTAPALSTWQADVPLTTPWSRFEASPGVEPGTTVLQTVVFPFDHEAAAPLRESNPARHPRRLAAPSANPGHGGEGGSWTLGTLRSGGLANRYEKPTFVSSPREESGTFEVQAQRLPPRSKRVQLPGWFTLRTRGRICPCDLRHVGPALFSLSYARVVAADGIGPSRSTL